ncbi:hypothetical protein A19Y_1139 [Planktothrix agardhii NIVA-CYA 126/8]|uniref:Uncharacterized protein n=2 Tax=Planktothrix agardhii TaxID=1160 RepID=A0A073CDN1_PLAA1|nr:hypothetical protein A19Y_1139 [Planktothrix agardhii NIVA-CYA 126/8]
MLKLIALKEVIIMSIRDLVLAKLEELPETLLQEVNQAIDKIIDQNLDKTVESNVDEKLLKAWLKWFEGVDQLQVKTATPINEYQQILLNKYRQQGLNL